MKAPLIPVLFLFLMFALLTGCGGKNDQITLGNPPGQGIAGPIFKLEQVANQLTSPVVMTNAHDGSGRHFVVEQPGRIQILKEGKIQEKPFLDLTSVVVPLNNAYSEMGLLGLAFHPDFKTNGRFFVYYTAPTNQAGVSNRAVLAEYTTSSSSPDEADPKGKVLLEVDQPESNHNGGNLAFGPDGFLYLGLGDGGGGGDQHGPIGNAQNPEQLLGSIIRIDVDKPSADGLPYSIPEDNPFVGKPGRDEIYANGLRNPWRFSFDRETGKLFCGDVGQNKYEEVDIIEKGKNYGWRPMEGLHVYDEALKNRLNGTYTPPITEYEHSVGNSVTGGFVYRGKQFPALTGKYIFADWSGRMFYLEQNGNDWVQKDCVFEGQDDNKLDLNINSFGEDENGELYVVAQRQTGANSPSGVLYKVTLAN